MMSADTLASYGSLARFKDVQRLKPVGEYTVVGAGGDMSDFQYLEKTLEAAMYVSISSSFLSSFSAVVELGGVADGVGYIECRFSEDR